MANVKKNDNRRGLALVETALVLLILMTITLGVIEYGWFFYKSHQIANAARQAARIGARPSSNGATVTTAAETALTNAGIPLAMVSIGVSPAPDSVSPGQTFQVTLTADYTQLGLNMPLVPTPNSIISEVTMAREGP
jgi:Flp pilus assembly protein TadG